MAESEQYIVVGYLPIVPNDETPLDDVIISHRLASRLIKAVSAEKAREIFVFSEWGYEPVDAQLFVFLRQEAVVA